MPRHLPNLAWTYAAPVSPGRNGYQAIELHFKNIGNVPTTPFTVKLVLDGTVTREDEYFKSIEPGWGHGGTYEFREVAPGPHVLDATLDAYDDLEEPDKSDNHVQVSFDMTYLIRDGGTFAGGGVYGNNPRELVRVAVERDTVPPDQVEFVLLTPGWMNSRKEVLIHESPKVGNGTWSIYTLDDKREDHNGLYTYQLDGGSLGIRRAGFLGTMQSIGEIRLTHAIPGSRVRFIWIDDDSLRLIPDSVITTGGEFNSDLGIITTVVEENAVGSDTVEFVLVSTGSRHKEIVIYETPAVGTGKWTIYTEGARKEDRNGLYTYQLHGGSLLLRGAGFLGIMSDLCVIDITGAKPGSRITFNWSD